MENIKRTEITFNYKGKEYRLCLCPADIYAIEKKGFNFLEMDKLVISYPEIVFVESFNTYNGDTPEAERSEIFHELAESVGEGDDENNINAVLMTMVIEAINEARSHKGNVKWKVAK